MKKYLFGFIFIGGVLGVLQTEAAIEKECPENDWDCLAAEAQQNHNVKMNTKAPLPLIERYRSVGDISVKFDNDIYTQTTNVLGIEIVDSEKFKSSFLEAFPDKKEEYKEPSKEKLEEMTTYLREYMVGEKIICKYKTLESLTKDINDAKVWLEQGKMSMKASFKDGKTIDHNKPADKLCKFIDAKGEVKSEDEGFADLEISTSKTEELFKKSAPKSKSLPQTGVKGMFRSFFDWVLGFFR